MAHEQTHVPAPKHAAKTESVEPNLEAEHDPARARKVSNAALTQFAAKSAANLNDEDVEQRTIVAGFRSAQHALDAAGDAPAQISAASDVALMHLQHVSHAAATFGGDGGDAAAIEAANAFAASLERIQKLAPDAVPLRLRLMHQVIRNGLGLDAKSPVTPTRELGADKSYVANAIGAALQLLAVRARSGYQLLEMAPAEAPNRDAQVAALADELHASSKYVGSLLGQLSFQDRHVFVQDVEAAGREVQKLVRWIRSRTPHKELEHSLGPAMSSFDVVLLSVGLPSIERTDAATLSEHAVHTGDVEKDSVNTAAEHLRIAIRKLGAAEEAAVTAFEGIAKLDDTRQPPLILTILKAVASTALNFYAGELIKILTTVTPAKGATPAVMVKDDMRTLITMGINAANSSFQGTWAAVTSDHSIALARVVFANVMRQSISERASGYEQHATSLVNDSAVSAAQLEAMTDAIKKATDVAKGHYIQQLAHDWASYLARANLGRGVDGTARVRDDYFGKSTNEGDDKGREFGTSKQGTPGVLQLVFVIDQPGLPPRQDMDATQIVGLNTQLAKSAFENAGNDFRNVRAPKEIHVHAKFGRAIIALDEHNAFRDAINWDQVVQDAGMPAYRFWTIHGHRLRLK